ncbi:FCD domain-containing protein [Moraxella atlantae]|uniref:Pyruvate dehydrogenase complex repressor n=1 Tax=Faucicola atlantae TaxID=34059 RepID=A0A378Q8F7_9GAMM|nr:FCD domain-containing protein [Moraxella atlantae]OPH37264.1 transcriptional regulator LldR [Moraxella atlantae]STY95487.1 Pyruvate dehydrogenase complex repressor [Moraxella atlantae]
MKVSVQTAEALLLMIEAQNLPIGARLPAERALCQELQVSRAALREAIGQLIGLGVLESRAGSGTFVRQPLAVTMFRASQSSLEPTAIKDDDADPLYRLDVYEARLVLEAGTAWYAAQRATPADIEHIRAAYDRLANFQRQGNTEQAALADAQFHLAIAQASHNLVLLELMHNLFERLQHNVVTARRKIYTQTYEFDKLHAQHSAILAHVSDGEPQAAREAICEHIGFVNQQITDIELQQARTQRVSRLGILL